MIKALFTALTGMDDSIDSQESQASWEHQKYVVTVADKLMHLGGCCDD